MRALAFEPGDSNQTWLFDSNRFGIGWSINKSRIEKFVGISNPPNAIPCLDSKMPLDDFNGQQHARQVHA